ncbi:axonemal dynein light chain domain-containing protein 1 [Clarias magur]|uniref:Axonemal dynein light chain domain-containing protein 1 n=1 Tax=Clarias magur TaxID=1594786 RepID=A0A8J4TIH9_CLAMG|nr:axonemal dynein light chain domain-containing protein 1 [Clarias magur]
MSSCVKSGPSPPALPKPESRRSKRLHHSAVTPVEENDSLSEFPEVKDRSSLSEGVQMPVLPPQNGQNYFIPDELISTLTSAEWQQNRVQYNKTRKHSKVCGIRAPDAVWHHSIGRKKYHYFLDQPTSVTGAGSKFTVLLEDEQKRLKNFPSMKPSGRLEAVQLMRVMDDMLEKAGASQELEVKGISQIQGLLELVQVEQNIYNIVFHELIRQVIKLNNLQLVSRLHLSEQAWSETAEHFTTVLTAKDSEDLKRIMQQTDQWKEQLTGFMENLIETENKQYESIRPQKELFIPYQQALTMQCERIEIDEVLNMLREFVSSQNNFFDHTNLTLCDEVGSLHVLRTRWMVDLLLLMVPDESDAQDLHPPPSPELNVFRDVSYRKLEDDAKSLEQKLNYFSKYIAK